MPHCRYRSWEASMPARKRGPTEASPGFEEYPRRRHHTRQEEVLRRTLQGTFLTQHASSSVLPPTALSVEDSSGTSPPYSATRGPSAWEYSSIDFLGCNRSIR